MVMNKVIKNTKSLHCDNNINKKSKLRKRILRTDSLLLNREDVTLLLIAANPGTDCLIIK